MSMGACMGGGSSTWPINELPESSNLRPVAIRIIVAIGPGPEASQVQQPAESALLSNR